MNDNENEHWSNLMKAYFGKRLSEDEAALWEREMNRPPEGYRPLDTSNAEIAATLRWANSNRDDVNVPGKAWCITIGNLRSWIYAYRRHVRDEESPNLLDSECLCGGEGWLSVREEKGGADGWTECYEVACDCEAGQRVCRMVYPQTPRSVIRAQARDARRAILERRAAIRKLDVPPDKRRDKEYIHKAVRDWKDRYCNEGAA